MGKEGVYEKNGRGIKKGKDARNSTKKKTG